VGARAGNWSENSFPRAAQVSYSCRSCWSSIAERSWLCLAGGYFAEVSCTPPFCSGAVKQFSTHQAACWQEHLQPREPRSSVIHYLPFLDLSSSVVLLMASRPLYRVSTGALITPQRASCRIATRPYSLLRTSRLPSRNTPCLIRPALVVSSSKWANTAVIPECHANSHRYILAHPSISLFSTTPRRAGLCSFASSENSADISLKARRW
jgi:hypothetical protein